MHYKTIIIMYLLYQVLDLIFVLTYFFSIDQLIIKSFISIDNIYINFSIIFIFWLPFTILFLLYLHPFFQIIFYDRMVEKLKIADQIKYRFTENKLGNIDKKEKIKTYKELFWWTIFSNILITIGSYWVGYL